MNNNEFLNIRVDKRIEMAMDNAVDMGVERAYKELKQKKSKKIKIAASVVAACLSLIFILGIANPAAASKVPIVGGVFKAIEKNLWFPGEYSKYATEVNKNTSNKGINITLTEILCDGQELYVTYMVKSKEPFKNTSKSDKPLDVNQLITYEDYKKVSFSDKELDDTGIAGLEGRFIDKNTFIGMKTYHLRSLETKIPDDFEFKVVINSIKTIAYKKGDKDQKFNGEWEFKVPVKVDRSISKTIAVNYTQSNGVSLNSIIISPTKTIVTTSNINHNLYGVRVFNGDKEISKESSKISDKGNEQTDYLSPLPKGCKKVRVVIYRDKLEEVSKTKQSDGSCNVSYKTTGEENILDKSVEIK